MNIHEKLTEIQGGIAVPKSRWNDHGKFSYRSCEDILNALKPYLKEYKLSLTITDELHECGGRVHIRAVVILHDLESGEFISTSAYAAEAAQRKGMDEAQISGAASTYARKYALNGLLLLDDSEGDPDASEEPGEQGDTGPAPYKGRSYKNAVGELLKKRGVDIKVAANWKPNLPQSCQSIPIGKDTTEEQWRFIYEAMTS